MQYKVMKEKKKILAVLAGVTCIVATASLMMLPMTFEPDQKNPYKATIEQLESSENRMLNLIDQEKSEFYQLKEQVFSP